MVGRASAAQPFLAWPGPQRGADAGHGDRLREECRGGGAVPGQGRRRRGYRHPWPGPVDFQAPFFMGTPAGCPATTPKKFLSDSSHLK